MESILNGVISGIVLAFLIGPVFFTILQTSIERGFLSGFYVAVGVSLSDAFYISICYLGVYQIYDEGNFKEYLAYFGGGVLLVMGLYYLIINAQCLCIGRVHSISGISEQTLHAVGFEQWDLL